MQISFQKELIIKILPLIILLVGGFISFYAGKGLARKDYYIFQFNEFYLNVSSDFELKNINESKTKKNDSYKMFFSYPKEMKE